MTFEKFCAAIENLAGSGTMPDRKKIEQYRNQFPKFWQKIEEKVGQTGSLVSALQSFKEALPHPPEMHPVEYTGTFEQKKGIATGRYLVVRNDGKMHLETFNGSGWAYNNNSIKYFYLPKIS